MEPIWETKPSLNPEFGWEPMPDGCLVFRAETGQVLTLNPAAELILTYCDGTMTVRDIFTEITSELAMPEPEFLATVARMVEEKALHISPP